MCTTSPYRHLFLVIVLVSGLSMGSRAQSAIKGRVIGHSDKKPIFNVNVFLSNATIGAKTNVDGTFELPNVKPGRYSLVVSIVGFKTYSATLNITNKNIELGDIEISAKITSLHEVVIKPRKEAEFERDMELFKSTFLGPTDLAADCKIMNPDIIDFDYDEQKGLLKASSYDFIVIENKALGYKLRYLLSDFITDEAGRNIKYTGSVLFEEIKGTPGQKRQWLKRRQEVYMGSEIHFFRSLLSNDLDGDGFRILQYTSLTRMGKTA